MEDDVMNDLLLYLDSDGQQFMQGAMPFTMPMQAFTANSGAAPAWPGPGLGRSPATSDNPSKARERRSGGGNTKGQSMNKRQRDLDKVRELEAVAAQKLEQISALAASNAELKFKHTILSDVVQLRDYQLRLARREGESPTAWPIPPQPTATTAASPAASPASSASSAPARSAGPPPPMLPPLPFPAGMPLCQLVRQPGSMRLVHAAELQPDLDVESMRGVGRLQLVEAWGRFLADAAPLLLALEADPADEAPAERLRPLMAESGAYFRFASVLAPDTFMAACQTHMETRELCAPEPGHWAAVTRALELTPGQVAELSAVYDIFSTMMRGILAERAAANDALAARGAAADPRSAARRPVVPHEGEVLRVLQRSMRKEAAAHLLLRGFVFGRTLSMVQVCKAAVHSYPFFPHATGLTAAATGREC